MIIALMENGGQKMNETVKDVFSKRFRQLLVKNNLTQKKFAAALGCTQTSVSLWATGDNMPYGETLIDIARYFGCSTDYLLGNDAGDSAAYFKGYKDAERERGIIRCEDCQFYKRLANNTGKCMVFDYGLVYRDSFCSFAEEKKHE